MLTLRVWFVMIAITTLFAGGRVWTATRPASAFEFPQSSTSTTITDILEQLTDSQDDARIDIYGNEIEDAVGDYRVDPRGDVYESHSPDTEVTHLGPPES